MLNMSDSSRQFIEKHLPALLGEEDVIKALEIVSDFLDVHGFGSDDEITPFGRECEAVYDDLYYNND